MRAGLLQPVHYMYLCLYSQYQRSKRFKTNEPELEAQMDNKGVNVIEYIDLIECYIEIKMGYTHKCTCMHMPDQYVFIQCICTCTHTVYLY